MFTLNSHFRLTAFVSCCLVATSVIAGSDDGRLDIYWIDVEGGTATLIVTPVGESILIDTGLPKNRYVDRMRECIIESYQVRIPATGHTATYQTKANDVSVLRREDTAE